MNMQKFIEEIENFKSQLTPDAQIFLDELKQSKTELTDKGKQIVKVMQDNQEEYANIFTSKQLGELLIMSPRSVSGSMRKIINCGYVEKHSTSPVTYALTELGKNM